MRRQADVYQKTQERRFRVEKLAVNLSNKLAIFAEGAKNVDDKAMAELFKVCAPKSQIVWRELINVGEVQT